MCIVVRMGQGTRRLGQDLQRWPGLRRRPCRPRGVCIRVWCMGVTCTLFIRGPLYPIAATLLPSRQLWRLVLIRQQKLTLVHMRNGYFARELHSGWCACPSLR